MYPEDRHAYGMVDAYSVAHNLVLNTYFQPPFANGLTVDGQAIRRHAEDLVERYDVRTPNVSVRSLSGGNQQKMVVAREFGKPVKLLITAQPARGIDVGSIASSSTSRSSRAGRGAAVLLIGTPNSTDPVAIRPHCGDVRGGSWTSCRATGQRARDWAC